MPYPGSEFHRKAQESGCLRTDFEDYNLNKYILNSDSFGQGDVENLVKHAHESMDRHRNSRLHKLKRILSSNSSDSTHLHDYFPAHEPPEKDILDREIVMGENDWDVLGPGWYAVENWPPKIRWMGKRAIAYLMGDQEASHLCIKTIAHCHEMKLKISVGDAVSEMELNSGQWTVLKAVLPGSDGDYFIKVDIELNKTWIPDETIKNGDRRELGVAVQRIWLEP